MKRHAVTGAARSAWETLEGRLLLAVTPSDTSFARQWAMDATNASVAWETTTGSRSVVVADLDTGVDYRHVDLYQNIWINPAEIPPAVKKGLADADGDGLITFVDLNDAANDGAFGVNDMNKNGYVDGDDLLYRYKANGKGGWVDGRNGKTFAADNKYVDDIIGWDFAGNDNDPFDYDGHGTHTAGVIGATGDNDRGVAGVNWGVSIMALKIFDDAGGAVSDPKIAAAVRYSADAGARVSNNSYGGESGDDGDVLYKAIKYAGSRGQVFVAAAGNEGVNNDTSRRASYPATYSLANIISVAATTSGGSLASYSSYGLETVDIAAPGSGVLSTVPNNKYGTMTGTSMATPYVAGAVALLLAQDPARSVSTLKDLVLDGADEGSEFVGMSVSGGTLNIANAINGTAGTDHVDVPGSGGGGGHGDRPRTRPRRPRWPWRSVDEGPPAIAMAARASQLALVLAPAASLFSGTPVDVSNELFTAFGPASSQL